MLRLRPGHPLAARFDSTVTTVVCWSCREPSIVQGQIAGVRPTEDVLECPHCLCRMRIITSVAPLDTPISGDRR